MMNGGTETRLTRCCAVPALNPNFQMETFMMTMQRLHSIAELKSVLGTDDVC